MQFLICWLAFGGLLALGYHLRGGRRAPWWWYALMVAGSLALFVLVVITPLPVLQRWAVAWRRYVDAD